MRPIAVMTLTFALSFAVPTVARATHPTPHERIAQAMRPVNDQLTELNATESERRDLADIIARGESIASELVEADHRHETDRVRSLAHHIDLLRRVIRGRLEAERAEQLATEAERTALETEARRVQARAALERAAERRLELERVPAAVPASTPAPVPAASATPAATPATATHPAARARPAAVRPATPRRGPR